MTETQSPTTEVFIQPKITGYRQLSQEEVALMNEGKALAERCVEYVRKLRDYIPSGSTNVDGQRMRTQFDPKPGATLDQR